MRVAACAPSSAGTDATSGAGASSALRGAGPIRPVLDTGMCLDAAGGSEANGTLVQIAHCSGNKAQAWLVSGTQVRIFANKCLSVVGGQAADGTHLQIWDCNIQDPTQSFSVSSTELVYNGHNKCLDLPYGNTNDGTVTQLFGCSLTDTAQAWTFPASQAAPTTTAPAGTYTKLVWSDEFEGASLDTSKWTPEITCAPNNNEQECYTASAQNVAGDGQGNLVIKVIKTAGLANNKSYTSARINTQGKGDWSYGRFEMRAKMPQGQGLWPAFWMMPSNSVYGTWPTSGELDIAEVLGSQVTTDYGTAHYGLPAPYTQSQGIAKGAELSGGFHVYALERDAHQVRWYLDGALFYTLNDNDAPFWPTGYTPADHAAWPFSQDFYLILNVAMGGDWPGAPDPSILGGAMTIDYVRVYQ